MLGRACSVYGAIGSIIGPSFAAADVPAAVERIVDHYLSCRRAKERFIDTVRRMGAKSFASAAYAKDFPNFENERETVNG